MYQFPLLHASITCEKDRLVVGRWPLKGCSLHGWMESALDRNAWGDVNAPHLEYSDTEVAILTADSHFCGRSTHVPLAPGIQISRAVKRNHVAEKVQSKTGTLLSWTFWAWHDPTVVPQYQPDVPIWTSSAQAVWGYCRAAPDGLSGQGQCVA